MYEYIITITGDYDILVLSPQIVAQLIEKIKDSNTKKVIHAEEIIPQGYDEYLLKVLEASPQFFKINDTLENSYKLISKQINSLHVNEDRCFEYVSISQQKHSKAFDLSVTEKFYLLTKQKRNDFSYVYSDLDGREVKLSLIYQ